LYFVCNSFPTLKTIKSLVYKRGYAKIEGKRVPLTDNAIIEKSLGKYGIVCVEDLVHELHTVGPHFTQVSRFLWPFKLSSPRGGYNKKGSHFAEGGDYGNREKYINDFVQAMV
jgi:large subunit ribosomal protein L7e